MKGYSDFSVSNVRTTHVAGAAAVAGLFGVWLWVRRLRDSAAPKIPDSPGSGLQSDEITLIGFPRVSDVVSSCSPFVAKVEAWLRFAGLPYDRRNGAPHDSPKGQLPCIQHGKRKVADSAFIIKYLERTYPEVVPQLTAEQEALSVAVQHLVESFLYWGLFYHRWINPKGWEGTRKFFLAGMPEVLRLVVLEYNIRPSMRSALRSYGLGRHSERDINLVLDEGLAALSAILGDKRYLLGAQPCTADACAFGFLDNVFFDTDCLAPDLREMALQYDNLLAYTERIRSTFFEAELNWEETS